MTPLHCICLFAFLPLAQLNADPLLAEVAAVLAEATAKVESLGGTYERAVVELNFTNRKEFTGKQLVEILPFHEHLQSLNLSYTGTGDVGLDHHLWHFSALRKLNLRYTLVTDEGLRSLKSLKNLERLDVEGTAITGLSLIDLKDLTSLRQLDLGDTKITRHGVKCLKVFRALEELSLAGTHFDNSGMRELAGLPNLSHLEISRTKVKGDLGLGELPQSDGFRNLRSLSVGDTDVTDAAIPHLAGLPKLQDLVIYNSEVSPAGLMELAQLRKLGFARALLYLVVSEDQLTEETRGAITEAFPELKLRVVPNPR